MITESKHSETGIYRFEINTVNAEACRAEIERSGLAKHKDGVGDTINYYAEYKGAEIHVKTTPTRTILFGKNRYAMLDFLDLIKGDERIGTYWPYDDSKRSDHQNK